MGKLSNIFSIEIRRENSIFVHGATAERLVYLPRMLSILRIYTRIQLKQNVVDFFKNKMRTHMTHNDMCK